VGDEQARRVDEARWATAESIARICASSRLVDNHPDFGWRQRCDAALDGITGHILECGWPDGPLKPLYDAANAEIMKQRREILKHQHWGNFWVAPTGACDQIAEDIADRIGVRQVCWSFSPGEWEAVWAEAERIRRGEDRAFAAALIGISAGAFTNRLMKARRRAAALWVAAGDTPARRYVPQSNARRDAGGGVSRSLYNRRQRQTPEARERDRERKWRQRHPDEAA
jgi:hypothetical protein